MVHVRFAGLHEHTRVQGLPVYTSMRSCKHSALHDPRLISSISSVSSIKLFGVLGFKCHLGTQRAA